MHERIVEIDHTFWTYLLFHPLYLLVFILRHLGFTCSIATFAGNPIWNFDTPMPHGLRKVFEGTMVVWPITGKTMVWRPGKGKHSPPGGNEVHTRGGLGGSGCSYTTKNQANLHGKKNITLLCTCFFCSCWFSWFKQSWYNSLHRTSPWVTPAPA